MKKKTGSGLKLTTRGRHAVIAMVELAGKGGDKPVPLSQIAQSGNISLSYLEQLFAGLRRHGLVRSFRGPGGGYILAKPAKDIRVSEILISAEDCAPARRNAPEEPGNPQTEALWLQIGEFLHACLKEVSLEDVTNDNLSRNPVTQKLFG